MAFVNDYLTNEEKEIFKQRAIPTGVFWKGGILGYDPYSKVKCTLDRDEHIYLFDLGKYHDAEDLDAENFALVWDSLSGNEAIHIIVKMKYIGEYIPGIGYDILWHSLSLGLPKNLKSEKATIIDKFKEALVTFDVDGDPRWKKTNRNIKFDFEAPEHHKEKQDELVTPIREVARTENEGKNRWELLLDSIAEPKIVKEESKIKRKDDLSDIKELNISRTHSGECEKYGRIAALIKGGRELFDHLRILFESNQMNSNEILYAFGCMAGVACQQSVMTEIINGSLTISKNDIVFLTKKNNQRFILSSKFDDRLFKNANSVDSNVLQVTREQTGDNHIQPILNIAYKNYMKLRGTDDLPAYGWILKKEKLPSTEFCNMIASTWQKETIADIKSKYCHKTEDWHILFSIAIQNAIKFYIDKIKREETYFNILSGAMIMSKLDLFPETTEKIIQTLSKNNFLTYIDPLKKDKWEYVKINKRHKELIANSGLESALSTNHKYCCINTKTQELLFATFPKEDIYKRMETQSAYTFMFYSDGEWYKFTEHMGLSFVPLSLSKLCTAADKSYNWQPVEILIKKLNSATYRFMRGKRSAGITSPVQGIFIFFVMLLGEFLCIKEIFSGTASNIKIIFCTVLAIIIAPVLCMLMGGVYMYLKNMIKRQNHLQS